MLLVKRVTFERVLKMSSRAALAESVTEQIKNDKLGGYFRHSPLCFFESSLRGSRLVALLNYCFKGRYRNNNNSVKNKSRSLSEKLPTYIPLLRI